MDDVDPRLLRILRIIAERGSMTAAAAALGYSQPAISQLVRRAEERLGRTLVLRNARGVTLTESGRVLARHALRVQAAIDAASEELTAVGGLTRGRVRIAGFPSASSTLVPALLAAMSADIPGVSASYIEAEPPEAIEMVRRGDVDVALTFTYDGADIVPDATLTTRILGRDPLALVRMASNQTAKASTDVVDLASERDARWIGGCPQCRGHLLASCASAEFTPNIVLETDNAAAVVGLVAAGLGVALLPRLALLRSVVPDAVAIDAVDDRLARQVEVVIADGAERVPSVRATLDAVQTSSAAFLKAA